MQFSKQKRTILTMKQCFEDIQARVLFEDNHLILVNKCAGEIVQGDKTGDVPLIEKVRIYLKIKYNKPGNVFCGLVHRIDRPVSGIVIFAKTSKMLARMNLLLRERKISKIYWAIVENKPLEEEKRLIHYLQKNEKLNKSFVSPIEKEGYQKAELSYKTISELKNYTLLEVELFTGRHHQIRAQLASCKIPIKGDLKYGAKRSNPDGSISLHARKVIFEHPVSRINIIVEAAMMGDNKKIFNCN
jgi:23S rRNA pseudouridine1911/1915/1917 synthase